MIPLSRVLSLSLSLCPLEAGTLHLLFANRLDIEYDHEGIGGLLHHVWLCVCAVWPLI